MASPLDNNTGKRVRTDGGRREDDWICPNCGNFNYSFRTTCNRRNCTQSRPTKSSPRPLHVPSYYGLSRPTAGSMAPGSLLPMYFGAPPNNSSVFNRFTPSPYAFPRSGGAGYRYGIRFPIGSPQRGMSLPGFPPYPSGVMMASGQTYGMSPLSLKYNLGIPTGQVATGSRFGFYADDVSFGKTAYRENDWMCPKCGNWNYAFRTVCNMKKCNTSRPESQPSKSENTQAARPKVPEGSWKCEKCSNINFPFRTKCNRHDCNVEKPSETNQASAVKSYYDNQ